MAELFGMRAARLYAFGLAASFALLIALLPASATASSIEKLLGRALISSSWLVAGLAALAAARDLERRDREEGVLALVAQRGHDLGTLELSRALAAAALIAARVALPAALLVVVGLLKLRDASATLWALRWLAFTLVYAPALGLVLGGLARTASRLSPDRGRTVLALLILLPELARSVWPALPSVPSAFAWALERATSDAYLTAIFDGEARA
jgi:hypothetical protein